MQIPIMHPIRPPQAPLSRRSSDLQHDLLESGFYDPSILVDTYYSNPREYRHQNASVPIPRNSTNSYENRPSTAHTENRNTVSFAPNLLHVNIDPRFHCRAGPSVSGTGSSLVIPPSQSFVRDNPPHIPFLSHNNISASAIPQGMQNASVDHTAQRSQWPLISFDSNASITAPLHFSASNHPQGISPLSFPSPIPRAQSSFE